MTVERGGVGGIVNPLEIRETALDIGQIAFLLGTYCVRLKGDAETLEKKKNRLINKITGKRSTKDEDVMSNAFHYNTPANSPIDCYFNSSDATKVTLKYEVGCRLWDFSNLKMSGDGESALNNIKTSYTDDLNGNLKKIMKQEQIDILESADSIDASIYAMNVHTGAYSEHPKEGIKWADIIFAAGVAGNMADDEYSAANRTGEGIKEENKDLYNGILRFRKASEYLDKGNPGQNQDAYVIEKWDGEKWVAMKWVSKEDMKKIENEYSKRTKKYKKPNPKPDPKDDEKDKDPEQETDDKKNPEPADDSTNDTPKTWKDNKDGKEYYLTHVTTKEDGTSIDRFVDKDGNIYHVKSKYGENGWEQVGDVEKQGKDYSKGFGNPNYDPKQNQKYWEGVNRRQTSTQKPSTLTNINGEKDALNHITTTEDGISIDRVVDKNGKIYHVKSKYGENGWEQVGRAEYQGKDYSKGFGNPNYDPKQNQEYWERVNQRLTSAKDSQIPPTHENVEAASNKLDEDFYNSTNLPSAENPATFDNVFPLMESDK